MRQFCLDTLPFVPPSQRGSLIAEIRRVLRPGSPAIFTLPVEAGAALFVREGLRCLSGAWRDGYGWREFRSALFGRPTLIAKRSGLSNLIGYDYRPDERLIRSHFLLRRRQFLPIDLFRWVSPTVLLICGTGDGPDKLPLQTP